MEWWVYRNGNVSDRPLTRRELREKEYVDAETYVCRTGRDSWIRADEDPELEDVVESEDDTPDIDDLELDEDEATGPRATPAFNVDHTTSSVSPPENSPPENPTGSSPADSEPESSEDVGDEESGEFRKQSDVIATSVWKRPLAFGIDYGIFYLFFWLGTRYYLEHLILLETRGIVLGHSVFFLYLAVFNSEIGGSSSIGKKLVGLRVKNEEGFSISFFSAFTRYFFLIIPLVLFGVVFTDLPGNVPDVVHVALVMTGMFVAVALAYLYLFNQYRRSLHDCVTSTAVVEDPPKDHLNFTFWRPHLYFIGVCFALSIYGTSVVLAQYGRVVPLLNLHQNLLEDPRVLSTEVPIYKNYTTSPGSDSRTLYVNVWVRHSEDNFTELKRSILTEILDQSILLDDFQTIQLGIATGVNLGLHSRMEYRYDRRSLKAWEKFQKGRLAAR